jgi:prephenate dehydrogenase
MTQVEKKEKLLSIKQRKADVMEDEARLLRDEAQDFFSQAFYAMGSATVLAKGDRDEDEDSVRARDLATQGQAAARECAGLSRMWRALLRENEALEEEIQHLKRQLQEIQEAQEAQREK